MYFITNNSELGDGIYEIAKDPKETVKTLYAGGGFSIPFAFSTYYGRLPTFQTISDSNGRNFWLNFEDKEKYDKFFSLLDEEFKDTQYTYSMVDDRLVISADNDMVIDALNDIGKAYPNNTSRRFRRSPYNAVLPIVVIARINISTNTAYTSEEVWDMVEAMRADPSFVGIAYHDKNYIYLIAKSPLARLGTMIALTGLDVEYAIASDTGAFVDRVLGVTYQKCFGSDGSVADAYRRYDNIEDLEHARDNFNRSRPQWLA